MNALTPAQSRINNKAKEFFTRMKDLYGDTYDFSESIYTGSRKSLEYKCTKHGLVKANPNTLYRGHGCKLCTQERITDSQRSSTEEFISKSVLKFGTKYDYSNTNYLNNQTKVNIICPIHGAFWQTPEDHLSSITGCTACGNSLSHKTSTLPQEIIIKRFIDVHGSNFDYSNTKYVHMHDYIKVKCNRCKSIIEVTPNNHLRRDCPHCCSIGGFDQGKPGILYYLSVLNGTAYKIGITNNTVQQRFGADMHNITVLNTWYFDNGREAFNKELSILRENKQYRYTGPDLLKSGNTELFNRDILNLDITME